MLTLILVSAKKPEVVLHVGMHKTGTTFLQWNVFHYVDANYLWHVFYKSWLKDLLNPQKEVDYEKIRSKLSRILRNDKVNILSEENIYTYQFTKEDDRFVRLERIKQVFPEAKIIIGTRKEEQNLVSWYIEYVAVGGILDFQGFLDRFMNMEKLNYESYIKKLIEYNSKENVFIYTMEDLRKDQGRLVKRICGFMNVDPPKHYRAKPARTSYGPRALKISLFLNRFFKTPVNQKGLIPCWGPILPQNIIFHSFLTKLFPKEKITLNDLKNLKIDF